MKWFIKTFSLGIFILCVGTSGCNGQKNQLPEIRIFKNIKMYMTKTEVDKVLDSLVNNDPSFTAIFNNRSRLCEFTETSVYGNTYYGYILANYTNKLLTKLTIFYSPVSGAENVNTYLDKEAQALLYWGKDGSKVQNDLNIKLQNKYGLPTSSGNEASHRIMSDYTYKYREWEQGNLSVRLIREVEQDNGSNNFPFCNFLIEYVPSKDFLNRNAALLDEMNKSVNPY